MSSYLTILKALFRNKLRFDESKSKSKSKKILFMSLIALCYLLVMFAVISVIVELKPVLIENLFISQMLCFGILLTAALIVMVFGVVHTVSVLFLSKDTDFYSALPVKSTTVFAAKLSFVYLFETAVVLAVALPLMIAFGIVAEMWAWFYVIIIPTLLIVPSLPLVVSTIVAVPIMLIASKLKNRNIITLIFSLVLYGAFFGLYIYFIYAMNFGGFSAERLESMLAAIEAVLYVFYPFSVLSAVVCGVPVYRGLSVGASTAVGLVVFFAISFALMVVIWFLARLMYDKAVKANNQTYNAATKKSDFKTTTGTRALVKREYVSSLRTTQVAFQCYAVFMLPIIIAVIFGIMSKGMASSMEGVPEADELLGNFSMFFRRIGFCTLCAMFASLGNAASTTFSREGKALASLKVLPVKIQKILFAKVAAWLIIAVPVAVISVVVFNVMNFAWQDLLLSLFSLVPIAVVFVIFGALWDLTAPKLDWTDPHQAIKHNMHVLGGQMIMMASGLVTMVLMMILDSAEVSAAVVDTVCWVMLYGILAVFAVVDVIMYKNAEKYYNRIEL